MLWFTLQSLFALVLAFLLGLLVGRLYYGQVWRRLPRWEADQLLAEDAAYPETRPGAVRESAAPVVEPAPSYQTAPSGRWDDYDPEHAPFFGADPSSRTEDPFDDDAREVRADLARRSSPARSSAPSPSSAPTSRSDRTGSPAPVPSSSADPGAGPTPRRGWDQTDDRNKWAPRRAEESRAEESRTAEPRNSDLRGNRPGSDGPRTEEIALESAPAAPARVAPAPGTGSGAAGTAAAATVGAAGATTAGRARSGAPRAGEAPPPARSRGLLGRVSAARETLQTRMTPTPADGDDEARPAKAAPLGREGVRPGTRPVRPPRPEPSDDDAALAVTTESPAAPASRPLSRPSRPAPIARTPAPSRDTAPSRGTAPVPSDGADDTGAFGEPSSRDSGRGRADERDVTATQALPTTPAAPPAEAAPTGRPRRPATKPAREGSGREARPAGGGPAREGSREGRPAGTRPAPRDGRPPVREGRPAPREGRPAPREGRPAPREGRPAPREGRPAARDGRPAPRDGRPAAREGARPGSPREGIRRPGPGRGTAAGSTGRPSTRDARPAPPAEPSSGRGRLSSRIFGGAGRNGPTRNGNENGAAKSTSPAGDAFDEPNFDEPGHGQRIAGEPEPLGTGPQPVITTPAPARQDPARQTPTRQTPTSQTPTRQTPTRQTPAARATREEARPAGPRSDRWAAATAQPVDEFQVDNLQRVQGIGPKTAVALRRNGIQTFDDLAGASEIRLRDALLDAGVRPSPSLPTWNRQAQYLADGDEAGFAAVATTVEVRDAP